jgi:hypothetical protein
MMMGLVTVMMMMEEPFTIGVQIPDNEAVDNRHPDHEPAKLFD